MNFKELQDEVIAVRFNSSYRTRIKSWLNLRYQAIWELDDWNFKHVTGLALVVIAGDASPTMPADFAKAESLYDGDGIRLDYLDPQDWRATYSDPTAAKGTPEAYTVIDREIRLGPTPSASASFSISYLRRLSHVDAVEGVIGGVLIEDTDQPLWPAEYDYALIFDATIAGMQLEGDPNWPGLKAQRDELLDAMRSDLVGNVQNEQTKQVGRWGSDWC